MKKYILFVLIFLTCFMINAIADTVFLKDGRAIQGKIHSETRYSVKILVNDFPKVFYADEIDRVEYAEEQDIQSIESVIEGKISEEKKKLILRLLNVNGAVAVVKGTLRTAVGQLSAEKRKEFEGYLDAEELIQCFVPVYAKYFTKDEIKAMIRFYSGPAGKRSLEVSPKIMEESIRAAVDYFKAVEQKDEPQP